LVAAAAGSTPRVALPAVRPLTRVVPAVCAQSRRRWQRQRRKMLRRRRRWQRMPRRQACWRVEGVAEAVEGAEEGLGASSDRPC